MTECMHCGRNIPQLTSKQKIYLANEPPDSKHKFGRWRCYKKTQDTLHWVCSSCWSQGKRYKKSKGEFKKATNYDVEKSTYNVHASRKRTINTGKGYETFQVSVGAEGIDEADIHAERDKCYDLAEQKVNNEVKKFLRS